MTLERELQTYHEQKQRLLKESRGKFALIHGTEIVDIFTNYEDALKEGYKRFGNEDFLVQEITDSEKLNFITRHVPICG